MYNVRHIQVCSIPYPCTILTLGLNFFFIFKIWIKFEGGKTSKLIFINLLKLECGLKVRGYVYTTYIYYSQ